AVERAAPGVLVWDGRGGERDGADLQAADGLDVQVFRAVPDGLAQEGDRLGVEEGFLAVDVVGAFLARREREAAEGECPRFEQFQEPPAGFFGHASVSGVAGASGRYRIRPHERQVEYRPCCRSV